MQRPFGTWPSPLTAAVVASQGLRLSSLAVDGEDVYWVEGRPAEGGRNVIVRRTPDGRTIDVTPPGFNARTTVHEYGGTPFVVRDGVVFFSNFSDQRLYRVAVDHGGAPVPVTPAGPWRYADVVMDAARNRLIAVREDHAASADGESSRSGEPVNTLVSIPLDQVNEGRILASGYDFYSTPRLTADGSRAAWLAWRHPQMPWDGTELWTADIAEDGSFVRARCVAGGERESIYQPGWSPDGDLFFVSDRNEWWRLYRLTADGGVLPVVTDGPSDAEFGRPQWVFGSASWCAAGRTRLVATFTRRGRWHLALVALVDGSWTPIADDLEPREWLAATETHLITIAASATAADAVVRIDLGSGRRTVLRASSAAALEPDDISVAEPLEFTTGNGETAHAFFYAPRNSRVTAPSGERPPLIAIGHGGPTTASTRTLDLRIQYWTTRGFAVVDVNYRGSSGYGRPYRQRLAGQWGLVDVEDMVNAVRHLAAAARVDPQRVAIRGGSAGGYTALAAITFHPGVFTAAASYYGISDVEVLARDTHKFEARYVEGLIGAGPERHDVYRARSPIHFVDRIACPLILFQGLEDHVVPPNQSEMMAQAVRNKGLPVAYLAFEGEQHGFRRAETIVRCLEAELAFYGAVFGFTPADDLPPLDLANAPGSR